MITKEKKEKKPEKVELTKKVVKSNNVLMEDMMTIQEDEVKVERRMDLDKQKKDKKKGER